MNTLFPPSKTQSRTWTWWLGQATLYILLWASLIKLQTPASILLDPSWQMALGYAAQHNLQHGQDIIFTYGPLGYFMRTTAYMGHHFETYLTWQVLSNVIIAAGLYFFGRSFSGWRQFVYYLYMLWFGSAYADAMHMNFITIFGLMLIQAERPRSSWLIVSSAIFALFALVKFTNLVFGTFVIATLCSYCLMRKERLQAVLLGVSFVLFFIMGWMLCGQSVRNIPAFLRYGMQLSNGYVDAMGYYETSLVFWLGLLSTSCIAAYLVAYFLSSADRLKAFCASTIVGAVIFLNWKHGYVRADGHVFGHYVMILLIICTYPALTQDNRRFDRLKNFLLGTATLLCVVGIIQFHLPTAIEAPSMWNARLRENLAAVLRPSELRKKFDGELEALAKESHVAKPTIKAFIGNEVVDHLGSDQAISILNGFNYRPRPAIQGYTVYTDALNRFDEAFYRSERAPRFVLQRYDSIDDRLISLDDSRTLKILFQHYDYVLEEAGLILWERRPDVNHSDKTDDKIIGKQDASFGEIIAVPDSEFPLWATVKVNYNFLGKLRRFFYKPPNLHIQISDSLGSIHRLRFVRDIGHSGFILQPFLNSSDDLVRWQNGAAPIKVRNFSIITESRWENFFQRTISIELRELEPFTRASDGLLVTTPHRFRMMNRPPQRIESPNPAMSYFVDGKNLLQLHPPGVIEFDITETISSVVGTFGIMPGAFTGEGRTDGVEFIVEWEFDAGKTEQLYTRLLDPLRRTDDQSHQSFSIQFSPRENGKLRLRTSTAASGSSAWCWSFWTDISIR